MNPLIKRARIVFSLILQQLRVKWLVKPWPSTIIKSWHRNIKYWVYWNNLQLRIVMLQSWNECRMDNQVNCLLPSCLFPSNYDWYFSWYHCKNCVCRMRNWVKIFLPSHSPEKGGSGLSAFNMNWLVSGWSGQCNKKWHYCLV